MLEWSSTNATSCSASGGWSGSREVDGQEAVTPTATTNYSLMCSGPGSAAAQEVTVAVAALPKLTLSWTDGGGGAAFFKIERKLNLTGTYAHRDDRHRQRDL
jgi:hypothetical protein